jgi:hypothetical protein
MMKRFAWICVMVAASTLFACGESDDASGSEVIAQDSEALLINPCALVRCRAGTQCEVQKGHAVCVPTKPPSECTSDKECRLFSNYCDGCECLALSSSETDPVCKGNIVACFVDPCRNAEAQCVRGQCVLGGAAVSF